MIRVVIDPGRTPTLPARVEVAERENILLATELMARTIGEESRSRQISAATHAVVGGDAGVILVGEGVPFALIREHGGTIRPRRAKILRFADGQFRPRARQTGIYYIEAAAKRASEVSDFAFHSSWAVI